MKAERKADLGKCSMLKTVHGNKGRKYLLIFSKYPKHF